MLCQESYRASKVLLLQLTSLQQHKQLPGFIKTHVSAVRYSSSQQFKYNLNAITHTTLPHWSSNAQARVYLLNTAPLKPTRRSTQTPHSKGENLLRLIGAVACIVTEGAKPLSTLPRTLNVFSIAVFNIRYANICGYVFQRDLIDFLCNRRNGFRLLSCSNCCVCDLSQMYANETNSRKWCSIRYFTGLI